ncbi:MAG: dihydrofolate reductase family protein [Bacteroidales bacterium]
MRKVILYISMSVDGFIADKNGRIDWLDGDSIETIIKGSYPYFIKKIDTIIMGYHTYHQIVTELFPNEWPFYGKEIFVLTYNHLNEKAKFEGVSIINEDIESLVNRLKKKEGLSIWLCGGSATVDQFINHNLVDEFRITMVPKTLGEGIPLFSKQNKFSKMKLKLASTQIYNGIVEMEYVKK